MGETTVPITKVPSTIRRFAEIYGFAESSDLRESTPGKLLKTLVSYQGIASAIPQCLESQKPL
jgi:hypothetical protein